MNNYSFGYFAVAFIDVLGQQEEWRGLAGIPKDEGERTELLGRLRRTVGFLHGLRTSFQEFYSAQSSGTNAEQILPKEFRAEFLRMRRSEIKWQAVSDSIITSISLAETAEIPCPINGLYACLAACGSMMILSLGSGHVLRGGVDVAPGVRIPETEEIYGPALNAAYRLESSTADYPRIVIGPGLIEYLNDVARRPGNDRIIQASRLMATQCLSMFTTDKDGQVILDYLGPKIIGLLRDSGPDTDFKSILTEIGKTISHQRNLWKERADSRLIGRHERLRSYFNSRVPPEQQV